MFIVTEYAALRQILLYIVFLLYNGVYIKIQPLSGHVSKGYRSRVLLARRYPFWYWVAHPSPPPKLYKLM